MPTYEVWDCSDNECDSYTLLQVGDVDYEKKQGVTGARAHLWSFDASSFDAAMELHTAFLEGYRIGMQRASSTLEIVRSEEAIAESKEAARVSFGEKYPEATILTVSNGYMFGDKVAFQIRAIHPASNPPKNPQEPS